jgi:hypothetical protein
MAVANDLAMAALILDLLMRLDPLRDFGFDGLSQKPLSAIAKDAGQHIPSTYGWQGNDGVATLWHGGVLRGECGC